MSSPVDNNNFRDEVEEFIKFQDQIIKALNSSDATVKTALKNIDIKKYESYCAKLLSILIASYVNNAIKLLLENHCLKKHVDFEVFFKEVWDDNYKSTNFQFDYIHSLLGQLNTNWAIKYKARTKEKDKSFLDTIIKNRNFAAHPTTQFSLVYDDAKDKYKSVVKILKQIEQIVSGA